MTKQRIFNCLGIEETKDVNLIKQAYRKKLVMVNPEDDEKGFMELREAYEEALQFIKDEEAKEKEGSGQEDSKDKTEVERWLIRVDKVYSDIYKRKEVTSWEDLLRDDVWMNLDTSFEAGEGLIRYLLDHYYLPQPVWQVLDQELHFEENKEELSEKFAVDFLEFADRQVKAEGFLDFDLFKVSGEAEVDAYIRLYYKVKGVLDRGEETEASEELVKDFKELDSYPIYHPYTEVEKVRFYHKTDIDLAHSMAEKLLSEYPEDIYILYYYGKIKWDSKDYKEANRVFQQIVKNCPEHYQAKAGIAKYLMETAEYEKAKAMAEELLNLYRNDQEMLDCLKKANENLILQYNQKYEEYKKGSQPAAGFSPDKDSLQVSEGTSDSDPEDGNKSTLELLIDLGWCYYQNERLEECKKTLEEITGEGRKTYDFCYLSGRNYFSLTQYEKALEEFLPCLDMLKEMKEAPSEKDKKRLRRLGFIKFCVAYCYKETGEQETSIRYYKEAIEQEENTGDRLSYMDRLAALYLELKNNEAAIDLCDQIIQTDKNYYPAYLRRQEGYFNLRNLKGVMDDYYSCIQIYAAYVKPYLLAVKALYYAEYYKEAQEIVTKAGEAGLFSNELELFEIKLLNCQAESAKDYEEAVKRALELKGKLNHEENDIEDVSEVDYEITRLYYNKDESDKALEYIHYAIRQSPSDMRYKILRADIYLDKKDYETALNAYKPLSETWPEHDGIHYSMGRCLEETGETRKAIEEYKKTLELNPEHRFANSLLMNLYQGFYQERGRRHYYEAALSHADRQLELVPRDYYYLERGLLYMDGYEFDKAIADFTKSAELNPNNLYNYNNMGCIYITLRELDKAMEMLQKSISVAEKGASVLPYGNMATCYMLKGQYEKALEYVNESIELFPSNKNLYRKKANVYTRMGNYTAAIKCYKKIYGDSDAEKSSLYKEFGDLYGEAGLFLRAVINYKRAIKLSQKSSEIYISYGTFLIDYGFYRKAAKYYSLVMENMDMADGDYIRCCIEYAYISWASGQKQEAGYHADKALSEILRRFEPVESSTSNGGSTSIGESVSEKEINSNIGSNFQNEDKFRNENSSKEYKSLIEYTSFHIKGPVRCNNLGYIYLFKQDEKKAEEYFARACTEMPCENCKYCGCYEAYYGLGLVYEQMSLPEKALECYKKALESNKNYIRCKKRMEALKSKLNKK
jgi:tetratricopeptide (TPR) repeat protein